MAGVPGACRRAKGRRLKQRNTRKQANSPREKPAFARRRIRPFEYLVEKTIMAISFVSIAVIALIFVFVLREASTLFVAPTPAVAEEQLGIQETYGEMETYGEEYLDQSLSDDHAEQMTLHYVAEDEGVTLGNLFGMTWQPVSLQPKFGIIPIVLGSIKVALIAVLFGAPLAILAALYTSTFAPSWIKETVKPVIEILAGFPSVVIGFFALTVLASVAQNTFGFPFRLNAMVGGIALSLAVIPIVYTISEDAMAAVPKSLVEASLALGVRRWQTALFVVMPAAIPGIFAAVLLGIGRAVGETMIALMATGNAALISLNPVEPVRTMAATIGAEMAEVVFGDTHYSVLFFLGVLLFIFSFLLNATVELFVRQRLMKRFRGA